VCALIISLLYLSVISYRYSVTCKCTIYHYFVVVVVVLVVILNTTAVLHYIIYTLLSDHTVARPLVVCRGTFHRHVTGNIILRNENIWAFITYCIRVRSTKDTGVFEKYLFSEIGLERNGMCETNLPEGSFDLYDTEFTGGFSLQRNLFLLIYRT